MIEIKFIKTSKYARRPMRATKGSAGHDLCASDGGIIMPGEWTSFRTGVAVEIPYGYEGQVRPRSGLAMTHGVTLLFSPGTIDSDYRGEIMVPLRNFGADPYIVGVGDRIAQLVIAPIERGFFRLAAELEPTDRGAGGFGSTGM